MKCIIFAIQLLTVASLLQVNNGTWQKHMSFSVVRIVEANKDEEFVKQDSFVCLSLLDA